jgi:hypothetical protein
MYKKNHTVIGVELLDYPSSLGRSYEAGHYLYGCSVCEYLKHKYKEPQDIHYILSKKANEKMYNEICLQSTHCGPIIEKFLKGEYIAKYDGGTGSDDIQIEIIDNQYVVFEGKHRVCMAKRFGIKEIPVLLSFNE